MRFRVPKLLFNIAHFPKLNGADLTAIELCPFLEQAAGVACLIAWAVRHRPCCALLIKGRTSGPIVPALRAAQRDLGDRNE